MAGDRLAHRLSRTALIAGGAAVVLALLVLGGGLLGVRPLEVMLPGWPRTSLPAELCLTLAGAALLAHHHAPAFWRPYVALLAGGVAAATMALTLLPLYSRAGAPVAPYLGGILIALLVGVVAAQADARRIAFVANVLAALLVYVAAIAASFRPLMDKAPLLDMPLSALVIVLLLTYAAFAGRPSHGLITRLQSQRPGAVIRRHLLPAVLALPLVLSWVRLFGEHLGLFDAGRGALMLAVLTVAALCALVLWGAQTLDLLDARRNEAERQANGQREWLRVTLTSCNDAVVATDPHGRVRFVNPAAESLLGRAESLLAGRTAQDAVPLLDERGAQLALHPLLAVLQRDAGTHGYRELALRRPDGVQRYVEVSVAPIHDDTHALLGGVMVMRDVSVRRESEQALRAAYAELDQRVSERTQALENANKALHDSLALLRGVTESTPDLIFVKDLEGRLVMANPATLRVIGKPEREILGKRDREYLADPAEAQQLEDNDRRVISAGSVERIEEVVQTPEGSRTFLSTKSPLRDLEGRVTGLIGVATDITERKRMENELREAQRFTQGLLETAPIILYLFDPAQGRVVYASGMGLSGLGYTPADLLRTSALQLARMVHPDDLPRVQAHLREYAQSDNRLREVEFRCRHQHGEWRWLHSRERLFAAGGGNLVLGVAVDVTDRKEADLERERLMAAEQRLRLDAERANRAKDEFLAIVSHELRSPLNALRGWGFLMSNARPLDASLIERATSAIKRNVDHQARLIDDLLDTSRIMSGKLMIERRPLNLVEAVAGAIDVVKPAALAKRIRLETGAARQPVMLEGDPARLHQVFVNLLSNAVKFTPEGGEVSVATRVRDGTAEIAVADTGAGIEPEFLPRVFERFSQADTSTTRKHGGLGIGLALVRHLTELHGGKVRAESPGVGQGATFTVVLPLPVAEGVAVAGPQVEIRTVAENALSGVRITSLDDDPDARDIIALTLKQAGARVQTVASGAELLSLLEEHLADDAPDVLLLDLAMPDEDGFSVLAKVRALEARKGRTGDAVIPAIAVTAFTELNRASITERGFVDHVSKPIDAAKLIGAIRGAMKARVEH